MLAPLRTLASVLQRRHGGAAPSRRPRRALTGPLAVLGLGAVAFTVFLGLGGAGAAPSRVSTDPQVIAAGASLYDTHCSSCHGVNGTGTVRAPELINVGAAAADFYLQTGRMPLSAPNNEAERHHPFFTEGQIQQLDSYINALPGLNGQPHNTGPSIPSILPLCSSKADNSTAVAAAQAKDASQCVTLSFGQQTFALNCSQCHQIGGNGGLLSKNVVIPSLMNAASTTVGEAIRVGPKPMPVFGPGQITEDQMSAIAHYVEYLHTPAQRGGLKISGFGPVAEGFVGILIGLGMLLFISRMIGNRG
jgi:ubiquinol-cytochrome c reductase cytochrome c subunit